MARHLESVRAAIQDAVRDFAHDVRNQLDDSQLRQIAMSGPANDFANRSQNVPSYRRLAIALTHDDDIRTLLKPEGNEAPILFSLIAGTELLALYAPAGILAGCLFEQLINNQQWTEESIRDGLLRNVELLRRVAKGKIVETTWGAGLVGFQLEPGQLVDTSFGRFSEVGARGEVFSNELMPASVVITARLPHRIPVHQRDRGTARGSDQVALNEVLRKSTLIQLAVIMAAAKGTAIIPVHTRQTLAEPHLGWMGFFRPPSTTDVMLTSAILGPAEIQALVHWADMLSRAGVAPIQVALDRLVTAITERRRPADMLIDGVTSWESLFGATPETTFRVTGALAVFLEEGYEKRMALRRQLDKIYGLRSRIVHGETVDADVARRSADMAIDVAKAAIRRIFLRDAWLLSLRTARERADAVLFGDPRLSGGPDR